MAAKLQLTGPIREYTKKQSLDKKTTWHVIQMRETGSPAPPKGLPSAASAIQYTVLLNDRQYNKLKADFDEFELPFLKSKILVKGEITLDLPMTIVDGEIGVVAFDVMSMDASRIREERRQLELQGAAAAAGSEEPAEA